MNALISTAVLALMLTTAAHADDQDMQNASRIRSQAMELRSRASEARQQASSVQSKTSSMASATSQMQSDASAAQSRLASIASEITNLDQDTNRLRSEAGSLMGVATQARTEAKRLQGENAKVRVRLTELLKDVYTLTKRVEFKSGELSDLTEYRRRLRDVTQGFERLTAAQATARTAMNAASAAHVEWMNQLVRAVATYAPHFRDLNDLAAIKAAAFASRGFEKEMRPRRHIAELEAEAVRTQTVVSRIARVVQDQLRGIGASPGLAVYNLYGTAPLPGTYWRERDEAVFKNVGLARQMETLTKLLRERREYLLRVIPLMWDRMLNVRIDSVNLQSSVAAGQTGRRALDLATVNLRIHDDVEVVLNQALIHFGRACAARARDGVNKARTTATFLNDQLSAAEGPTVAISRAKLSSLRTRLDDLAAKIGDHPSDAGSCQ